jgi:hypothetical protein
MVIMKGELKRIRKEAVAVCCKILFQHFTGGTEEEPRKISVSMFSIEANIGGILSRRLVRLFGRIF